MSEKELSIEEKAEAYDKICELLGIGKEARKSPFVALTSIENIKGFSDKLFAIESAYFMRLRCEEDEEPEFASLLNPWGETTEEFVKSFGTALKTISKK